MDTSLVRGITGSRVRVARTPRTARRLVVRLVALVAALALWQLLAALLSPTVVPYPLAVAENLVRLSTTPGFWVATGLTIGCALAGFGISAAVGIPLGLLIGRSRFLVASTRLVIDVFRTIPAITLIPLLVLLAGPTPTMQIALIVFGAVWPLLLQSVYAARELDPVLADVSTALRLPRRVLWVHIVAPSAAPFVMTGIRVACTIALLLAVGAELVGNAPGIGREIAFAQIAGNSAVAYAYVVTAAILGVGINLVLAAVQRRVLFWHSSVRTAEAPR